MQAVFDGPMGAQGVLDAFGRDRCAHDVVAGFDGGALGAFAHRLDLADGGQARPFMVLLQPCHLVADRGAARHDAPGSLNPPPQTDARPSPANKRFS